MTFWPAPSKLWIAAQCGYPWGPQRPQWPKREAYVPTVWARLGTAFHDMAKVVVDAAALSGEPAATIDTEPFAEKRELTGSFVKQLRALHFEYVEYLNRAVLPRVGFGTDRMQIWPEVGIIIHMESMQTRPARDEEEAIKPPHGCQSAQIDLVYIEKDGRLVVHDYKTGWKQIEPAKGNWQLRVYSAIASRHFNADRVQLQIGHYKEDRGPYVEPCNLDELELEIIEAEWKGLLASIDKAVVPNPGPACQKCPVLQNCPVTRDALSRVKQAGDAAEPFFTDAIQNKKHAGALYRRLTMIQSAADRWMGELDAYAEANGPFDTAPGHVYGKVEVSGKRTIDVSFPEARSVLEKFLSKEAMDVALELKTSKEALKRAIVSDGGNGGSGQSSDLTLLMQELQKVGAIRQGSPHFEFKEVRKKGGDGPPETKGGEE